MENIKAFCHPAIEKQNCNFAVRPPPPTPPGVAPSTEHAGRRAHLNRTGAARGGGGKKEDEQPPAQGVRDAGQEGPGRAGVLLCTCGTRLANGKMNWARIAQLLEKGGGKETDQVTSHGWFHCYMALLHAHSYLCF